MECRFVCVACFAVSSFTPCRVLDTTAMNENRTSTSPRHVFVLFRRHVISAAPVAFSTRFPSSTIQFHSSNPFHDTISTSCPNRAQGAAPLRMSQRPPSRSHWHEPNQTLGGARGDFGVAAAAAAPQSRTTSRKDGAVGRGPAVDRSNASPTNPSGPGDA